MDLFRARRVHLDLIARQILVRAKMKSLEKRMERFLDKGAIRVREWYGPVAT
jgi:hypothetical protein